MAGETFVIVGMPSVLYVNDIADEEIPLKATTTSTLPAGFYGRSTVISVFEVETIFA